VCSSDLRMKKRDRAPARTISGNGELRHTRSSDWR
jgi:hypothetical protein